MGQRSLRINARRGVAASAHRPATASATAALLLAAIGFATAAHATGSGLVNISETNNPNPLVAGRSATFTPSITAKAPSTGTPTGTVDFTSGAGALCTATVPGGSCTATISGTGSITVTVFYNGDANFAADGISKTISVVPQTTTTLTSSLNPSGQGQNVTFTATVAGAAPTGTIAFKDGGSSLCGNVVMGAAKATCTTSALAPGNHTITAAYSGDPNNGASSSANLSQSVTDTTVNLNQFGLTGTWYNPATSGQGFLLDFIPDFVTAGTALVAGSWFTYDVAPAGGADKQRWYTFSGNGSAIATAATLDVFSTVGGNFNAGPKVTAQKVGQASLKFGDCGSGTFTYSFNDGRSGQIPLTRLTPNITCGEARDNGAAPGYFQFSGAWYDPNTSGQGLFFEVNPANQASTIFAAAWYTFDPNGQAIGGGASQRWYTLQANFTPGSKTIAGIAIFTRTGGVFDNGAAATQAQVGTATLVFQNCSAATLTFSFTAGSSAGRSGAINLVRLGPAPLGCNL